MKALSPVHHVVLRFLLGGASHGYSLHKRIGVLARFYPLRNVNIYAALRDLEDEGLAVSRTEIESSRARKVYDISERGREVVRDWIAVAPEDDGFLFQQDVTGLKLLLVRKEEQADLDWLSSTVAGLDEELVRSRRHLDTYRDDITPIAERTLRWRIEMVEQRRGYLLDVMRMLEAKQPAPAAG